MKSATTARLDAIQKGPAALKAAGGAALLAFGAAANAAALDVTEVTGALDEQTTSIVAIAGAVLAVMALIAAVGYVRRVIK